MARVCIRCVLIGIVTSAFVFCFLAFGQNISSSVKALIVDPSGAPLGGADCILMDQATSSMFSTLSNAEGAVTFPNVLAGTYRLKVQRKGFKTLEIKDITVTSSEVRTLGAVQMELGAVIENVTVTAQAAAVQLASAEKAGLIDEGQVNQIAIKGRDFFGLMITVPGVVDDFSQARNATSASGIAGLYINGGRNTQKNFTVDGVTSMDTGSNGTTAYEPNMDAIAEVKILTSNFQAEFGRNSGGVITVITKSGTQQFHGSAYDFYRHEDLNANNFFNNRTSTPRPAYRYRISGYSIGGPVYIPRKFNSNRNKLFFFWSEEFTGQKQDWGTVFANTPTAAERIGDFSNSLDVNGKLIPVRDPLSGAPFPGNIIPQDRINKLGQSFLNFFPLPNYVDPSPSFLYSRNHRDAFSGNYPRREELIRVDWNALPGLQVYYRYIRDFDQQTIPWNGSYTGSVNFMLTPVVLGLPGHGHAFHLTKTFSPTLVNEFLFGHLKKWNRLSYLNPEAVDRHALGDPPKWYPDPQGNPTNWYPNTNRMPNVGFGGQPINPVSGVLNNRPPSLHFLDIYDFVDNINKVWRSHNFKAGVYVETSRQFGWSDANSHGTFSFAVDANNPFNTGESFANALLGYITSYSETTTRPYADMRFKNVEWYMQDNWRVTRRLTLDIGFRFYHQPPIVDVNHTIAGFDPALFNPTAVPVLYQPALNASGQRVGRDPLTGALVSVALIGLYVPGSGAFANGMRVNGQSGEPSGLYTLPWLGLGPRFGFAYDVFGNGKTALRGGFGEFVDRQPGNPTYATIGSPPVAYTPTLYYGNLSTFAQASGTLGPTNITTLYGNNQPVRTMNYSLGIQHRVWNTTLDISYVGSLARHLPMGVDVNAIPMYARFDPNNADPTQPTRPLTDNFLRPYKGLGGLTVTTNSASSNYNALQTAINHRLARGFQFGISYTWSKVLGVANEYNSTVSSYFPARQRNYGPLSFDRSQWFVVNYVYDVPKLGHRLGSKPAGWVLDNWQISGITSFISGAPITPDFTTTDGADITGSSESARIDVMGSPVLSKGDKTFYRNFDTSVLRRSAKADFGNIGVGVLRGPGVNNWDVSASKRFPFKSEQRFVQFRTEMFNAWNHTQFSSLYTTARFDPAGNQIDPNFGAFSAARTARVIQLSLKLRF
jgi:hypothetical protein